MSDDEGKERKMGEGCLFMMLLMASRPSLPVWTGSDAVHIQLGKVPPLLHRGRKLLIIIRSCLGRRNPRGSRSITATSPGNAFSEQ